MNNTFNISCHCHCHHICHLQSVKGMANRQKVPIKYSVGHLLMACARRVFSEVSFPLLFFLASTLCQTSICSPLPQAPTAHHIILPARETAIRMQGRRPRRSSTSCVTSCKCWSMPQPYECADFNRHHPPSVDLKAMKHTFFLK